MLTMTEIPEEKLYSIPPTVEALEPAIVNQVECKLDELKSRSGRRHWVTRVQTYRTTQSHDNIIFNQTEASFAVSEVRSPDGL